MTRINSQKGQNVSSVPAITLNGLDLHPAIKEILKTELSVSIVCPPIHLGIVPNKVKKQSPIKDYGDASFKYSS